MRFEQSKVIGRKGCEQSITAAGHRELLTSQAGALSLSAIDACGMEAFGR